jgi:hypothetical protein
MNLHNYQQYVSAFALVVAALAFVFSFRSTEPQNDTAQIIEALSTYTKTVAEVSKQEPQPQPAPQPIFNFRNYSPDNIGARDSMTPDVTVTEIKE